MHRAKKIHLTDLNQQLTCKLCKGYFIDATTIIECLHSFCRSCIVKYLEKNKYCPVCDVQVHKTKPLLNIRPDQILQDIVYKLVPKLFHNEIQRRREFDIAHPDSKSTLEQYTNNNQHLVTPDESISLTLSYYGCKETTKSRYLRCPAAVSIGHLQKLIRAKYGLTTNHHVDILHNQDCLNSSLTLIDIAYIYSWKRKSPIELYYKIYDEYAVKKQKLNDHHYNAESSSHMAASNCGSSSGGNNSNSNESKKIETISCVQNNNNNWKEVQLRISENGEMSITGIQDEALELLNNNNNNNHNNNNNNNNNKKLVTVVETTKNVKKEAPDLKSSTLSSIKINSSTSTSNGTISTTTISSTTNCVALSSTTTKTVYSTINSSKCSVIEDKSDGDGGGSSSSSSNNNSNTKHYKIEQHTQKITANHSATLSNNESKKRKADVPITAVEPPPAKQSKPTVLNHSIGLHNLSDNHPLKKHSQSSIKSSVDDRNNGIETATTTTTTTTTITTTTPKHYINRNLPNLPPNRPSTPTTPRPPSQSKPCYMPKSPVLNVPKPSTSNSYELESPKQMGKSESKLISSYNSIIITPTPQTITTTTTTPATPSTTSNNRDNVQQSCSSTNNKLIKSKASTPIGYKTLRDPPKSWNSQIAKANINKPLPDPKYNDLKNVRPAKFFKMRNNLPRYLGNPASGVKPMYQLHTSPEKDAKLNQQQLQSHFQDTTGSSNTPLPPPKGEIKKHSIVKIDPKTLKPISEKAPETTSLSSSAPISTNLNSNDLKINTSSVSIFNPLKLQNSPKSGGGSDRKSPKSPHSPKTLKSSLAVSTVSTAAAAASSPSNKRENKLNLNFTPSNPFVPNLTSTTMNPNQFLYPPGFAPYDPRVMAAYHSLLYGQRMTYPSLSLDIGQQQQQQQRKNFEAATSVGPKLGSLASAPQQLSPQLAQAATMKLASDLQSTVQQQQQRLLSSTNFKNHNGKRSSKESNNKNEKSLQSAVEKLKLTQNRVKENKIETITTTSAATILPSATPATVTSTILTTSASALISTSPSVSTTLKHTTTIASNTIITATTSLANTTSVPTTTIVTTVSGQKTEIKNDDKQETKVPKTKENQIENEIINIEARNQSENIEKKIETDNSNIEMKSGKSDVVLEVQTNKDNHEEIKVKKDTIETKIEEKTCINKLDDKDEKIESEQKKDQEDMSTEMKK